MRTDHIHMVNIDDASRTHKKNDDVVMKTPDLQAARTAVAASAACWQLGDRRVCRWRHRPRRGSDLRGGCSALAPLGGSPRGARPAGPGAIGSAVRRRRRARHHRASGRAAIDAALRAPAAASRQAGE